MGVTGLQMCLNFDCPNGRKRVKLGEITQEYSSVLQPFISQETPRKNFFHVAETVHRTVCVEAELHSAVPGNVSCIHNLRNKTGRVPHLLVDLSSCVDYLGQEHNRGNFKNFKAACEEFLDKLHKFDVKIIVFAKGFKSAAESNFCQKRVREILEKTKRVKESGGDYGDRLDWHYDARYDIALEVFSSSDKCEFRQPLVNELAQSVRYAREMGRCFAIVTNNTNFVLADGFENCLGVRDFNLTDMTAYSYDRNRLAEFLQMDPKKLPLFGLLCPGNIFTRENLEGFYGKNSHEKGTNLFVAVAGKLRKYPSCEEFIRNAGSYQGELRLNDGQMILLKAKLSYYLGEVPEKELESPRSEDNEWNDVILRAESLFSEGRLQSRIFQVLTEKFISFYPLGESTHEPTIAESLTNLRRNLYGLLFFEHPGPVSATEYLPRFSQKKGAVVVGKQTLRIEKREHLGLRLLWDPNLDTDLRQEKLGLLCLAIDETLTPETVLSDVEERFVFPLLAVFCLLKLRTLKSSELDALLLETIWLDDPPCEQMADGKFDEEAFNVGIWFLEVLKHLQYLNTVCGHPFRRETTSLVNYFNMELIYSAWETTKSRARDEGARETEATFDQLKRKLLALKRGYEFRV